VSGFERFDSFVPTGDRQGLGTGPEALDVNLLEALAPAAVAWAWPLPGACRAPISSWFGQRNGRLHAGVDIAVARGTAVGAARAGTVLFAGWSTGYGNLVVVGHGAISGMGRVHTYYAHLQTVRVRAGVSVAQLRRIGDADSTGNSSGDHLHFELRTNCTEGQVHTGTPVDPLRYVSRCR
jgi:murein DD-endopeptidase MepM/ murein hydrolase activator NlpD